MYFYNDKNSQPVTGFIFHVLCKMRWVPVWLFFGVGAADLITHLLAGQAINWAFLAVCICAGLLLFQMGSVLCYQEYCSEQLRQQVRRKQAMQQALNSKAC
ncbi:MAG: hypothetical protein PHE17_17255 [Thiothrix sp.]|uniref:hypothetical protein n=1 Tax=Thiothrix sp. TaxID=1032 RepID=UPI0026080258|nr:hypothetical protein [Thiothrix sp.]MDD5394767.1 hypothetical protein [Thiothrix sp.]